jgi:hypothetical protein
MENVDIEALLPHRKPFLFVDKLLYNDEEGSVSIYTFKEDEFFFKGHFPDFPIVPGVILVETMAQAGGMALLQRGSIPKDNPFFLASIVKAKFRMQVRPNTTVKIEVKNLRVSNNMIRQSGKICVGEDVAAEAEWMCLIGKRENDNKTNG